MIAARYGEILANANPTATPGEEEESEDPAALIKLNHQHSKPGPAMPVRMHDGRRNLLCEPRLRYHSMLCTTNLRLKATL